MNIKIEQPIYSISENTKIIQNSIDEVFNNGGGLVEISNGIYEVSTIFLRKNVSLRINNNTVLIGSKNINDYCGPSLKSRYANGVGNTQFKKYLSLIVVENADNSSIFGEGTIDGRGVYGEFFPNKNDPDKIRPFLIYVYKSNNFSLREITLKDSSFYAFYAVESNDIDIDNVNIRTSESWNGDGLDFDGCKNIHITNCNIISGDDCISPKTYGRVSCENIYISNCYLKSKWAAIRIGTESSSDIRNIVVENCVFDECSDGIKIQSCGNGIYSDFVFNNIKMHNVNRPFFITKSHFTHSTEEGTIYPKNGKIQNVCLSNIEIEEDKNSIFEVVATKNPYKQNAMLISGCFDNKIDNIKLENIKIEIFRNYKDKTRYFVPEFVDIFEQYPEITHVEGELPCSVLFVRNINKLIIKNIDITLHGNDKRAHVFANNVSGEISHLTCNDKIGNLECYNSQIKGDCETKVISENLSVLVKNAKNYVSYVKPIASKIDEFLGKEPYLKILKFPFLMQENGDFAFIFPTVYGEFDVEVNGETRAKHRYPGNYKSGYMFACELNLKTNDTINIIFINKEELTGHHGVFEPTRMCEITNFVSVFKKPQ